LKGVGRERLWFEQRVSKINIPKIERPDKFGREPLRNVADRGPGRYARRMLTFRVIITVVLLTGFAAAQEHVSFPTQDGGLIHADLYGKGDRGIVLAHGGRFNKESWKKQAVALEQAGFRVLAIDFRGYGQSRGPGQSDPLSAPLHFDVLAAVRYLRNSGAKTVSVVGGSMGGGAAGGASIEAEPGEIDRLVFLGSGGSDKPEQMKGRKLFLIARDDLGPSQGQRISISLNSQYFGEELVVETAPNHLAS
jgi:pimeloyl-ACP methyl ester carboxylesterase